MSDRLTGAIDDLINAILPQLSCYVQWEYRVVGVEPGPPVTVSAVPVSQACPFGNLANITLWPGPDGGYCLPAEGSLVLVAFNDGSPAKPRIAATDPNAVPTLTTLAGGGPAMARTGDSTTVKAYFNPGSGGAVLSPVPVPGAAEVDLSGSVTGGSTKAVCG
jgi:hypothetical protein